MVMPILILSQRKCAGSFALTCGAKQKQRGSKIQETQGYKRKGKSTYKTETCNIYTVYIYIYIYKHKYSYSLESRRERERGRQDFFTKQVSIYSIRILFNYLHFDIYSVQYSRANSRNCSSGFFRQWLFNSTPDDSRFPFYGCTV